MENQKDYPKIIRKTRITDFIESKGRENFPTLTSNRKACLGKCWKLVTGSINMNI